MARRLLAALALRRGVFAGAAAGVGPTEAALVVLGVSVLASLGVEIRFGGDSTNFLVGVLLGFVGWGAQAGAARVMAGLLRLPPAAPFPPGALARVLSYAQAPRALLVLASVPYVGTVVMPLAELWALLACVRAIEASWTMPRSAAFVVGGAATVARLLLTLLLGMALAGV